jgi:hypothetical protein
VKAWRRALLGPRVFHVLSRLAQTRRVIRPETPSPAHDYNLGVTASKRYTRTRRAEVYYRLLTLTGSVVHRERAAAPLVRRGDLSLR